MIANHIHAIAAVADQAFLETVTMHMSFKQQEQFAVENGYSLNSYTLLWTDECDVDHELDVEALTDETAISAVRIQFRGSEGLVSCVSLRGEHNELSFELF